MCVRPHAVICMSKFKKKQKKKKNTPRFPMFDMVSSIANELLNNEKILFDSFSFCKERKIHPSQDNAWLSLEDVKNHNPYNVTFFIYLFYFFKLKKVNKNLSVMLAWRSRDIAKHGRTDKDQTLSVIPPVCNTK